MGGAVLGEPLFAHPAFVFRRCARAQYERHSGHNDEETDGQEHGGSESNPSSILTGRPTPVCALQHSAIARKLVRLGGMTADYSKVLQGKS